jgi:hypothetical protein
MPAQVVVVTDNRSLSLGLTGLEYDVLDLRPAEIEWWLAGNAESPALVVVGVEQPAEALGIVTAASGRHPETPSLVVSSTAPGWDAFADPGEHVVVLPLPVTRTSLVAAAQQLIAGAAPPATVSIEPATVSIEPPSTVSLDAPAPVPVSEPAATTATASSARPGLTQSRHMVASRSTDALRARLAQRADPTDGVVVAAPTNAVFDAAALRDDVEAPAPPAPHGPTSHRQSPTTAARLRELVEGVLAAVGELYDARDAATAVVVESLTAAVADSGVVLLPDGDVWRVTGAVGVRPLEWRYVLEPDSWLVTTVVTGDRGIIIEDSDIARQRLGGAPLAHHPQILAAPIPEAGGLVLVARETGPFTEEQLGAVADIAAEAASLLADALRVRDLARALSDFRAVVD